MKGQKAYTFLNKYPFLILVTFLLLAYMPVLLPYFHLKNDLISQNLPTRLFISESLYSKTFPWWNPYLNYGIPQYGDMNSGYWNPVLWIVARFFGYNVLTITLEEMFYILIGGWGIFRLAKAGKISYHYSLLAGLSYMSGGFILGHLQHFCWITGTAFFPYVLLFFMACIRKSSLKNFIAGGLFSFLFISSTHPGLIIGAVYFFFFLVAHLIFIAYTNKDIKQAKKILKVAGLYLFLTAAFSVIVIASNLEVLQYITRGDKVSLEETLLHPTTLQSYLSLLFPFAVHKGHFFNTDISMRNLSIGLALLPGIYFKVFKTNLKRNWILIVMFLFFTFLGAGGYFKLFAYHLLPYLGYVRLNGEFAYFTFLILILSTAHGLNKMSLQAFPVVKKSFAILQYGFGIASILFLIAIITSRDSLLFAIQTNPSQSLKGIIENLSFWDLCFVSSALQFGTAFLLRKNFSRPGTFLSVAAINLVVVCWGCLPFTGLGQKPRQEVQAILNKPAKGINTPNQKSINENFYIDVKYDSIIGSSAFYSKQIGYPTLAPYPVVLKSTDLYFSNDSLVRFINTQSYLFLSQDTTLDAHTTFDTSIIKVLKFTPTHSKVAVQNDRFMYLTFLQNDYPRWKVLLDGKPIEHFTAFKSFISIPIPKGLHEVEFLFDTQSLQRTLWLNLFVIAAGLLILIRKDISEKELFR